MHKIIGAMLLGLLAGGCGAQGVLLGARGEDLFTTTDVLARPGEPVELRARLQGGDFLASQPHYVIRFCRAGVLYRAAETNGDGVASVHFTPDAPGDYEFTVVASPNGFANGPPPSQRLLVRCLQEQTPIVVVDLDKTLVASGFEAVLVGQPQPMPDSPAVMNRLAQKFSIVYLTHRPEYFGPKSKQFLEDNHYPAGPVLLSNLREFLSGSERFKTLAIRNLKKRFPRALLGIGDKIADARSYVDNDLAAYVIIDPDSIQSPEELDRLADDAAKLPPQVQVVTTWRQIEAGVFEGEEFPPAKAAAILRARARRLEAASRPASGGATP